MNLIENLKTLKVLIITEIIFKYLKINGLYYIISINKHLCRRADINEIALLLAK